MRKILVFVLVAFLLQISFAADKPVGSPANRDKPALSKSAETPRGEDLKKLESVYKIIKENYVDEVADGKLFENAFEGMLKGLDPYSEYMTADEYKEFMVATKGEFGGIGVEITVEDGILTVITPLEDTPAFRAGILAGDRILEIDGESTEGMSSSDSAKLVRGKPGTQVVLTVLHKGETAPVKIALTREIIKIRSVKNAQIIDEDLAIGYLRITAFQEDTIELFDEAVKKLTTEGMKSLIIDLRFNGGGLMDMAVKLSNRFIKSGTIVSIKGKKKDDVTIVRAEESEATLGELPLAVLVNGGSASASEVFAGAMQDNHRGNLVGSNTFGKASVQTIFTLENGAAVKLTIAHYYTPLGRSINRDKSKKNYGLKPDSLVEVTPTQEAALIQKWVAEKNHRTNTSSEATTDEFAESQWSPDRSVGVDIQLKKAIEILANTPLESEDK
ncbi:MAG: S41 family peptidase [Planctomycetes bacterium]|nr:S41 family peptidase [Planctomycetota bacterium]